MHRVCLKLIQNIQKRKAMFKIFSAMLMHWSRLLKRVHGFNINGLNKQRIKMCCIYKASTTHVPIINQAQQMILQVIINFIDKKDTERHVEKFYKNILTFQDRFHYQMGTNRVRHRLVFNAFLKSLKTSQVDPDFFHWNTLFHFIDLYLARCYH